MQTVLHLYILYLLFIFGKSHFITYRSLLDILRL
jgi:hypothetical protein